jgi:hypothetical protein
LMLKTWSARLAAFAAAPLNQPFKARS